SAAASPHGAGHAAAKAIAAGLRNGGARVARGLGVGRNPLAGAVGPSNTMQPLPGRIAAALARVASRAVLWAHRLRPSVARSMNATRGLFDPGFYRRSYYDVSGFGDTLCAIHYAVHGWREGRQPGRLFDPEFYLREYPDVRGAGMSPLLHYVLHGADEWRAPHPELRGGSKLLVGGDWTLADWSAGESGDADEAEPVADGAVAPVDHWAYFEEFRSHIEARRRDARRAWAAVAPKLERVDPTQPEAAFDRLARTLRCAESPRVSIVIPVHGEVATTIECLLSVAAHTPGDYEVVLVDDASASEAARVLAAVPQVRCVRQDEQQGFGRTCNHGVETARADLVVLLNSDTQVRDGWLEPLIEALAEEGTGMVGPKLLFPEGVLQEAGGRLRFDGAGEMVGLFEDPDADRFAYRRVVDYASAAAVAFRRADFRRLGGFDDRYAPAYCEDADLCLRVQQDGQRVVYEPRSTVVHHLSKTTRASGQRNKLALAHAHQQVLGERWGELLEARDKVRLLAFYLPQFHAVPENDRWWGEGFTEWHNVAAARPRFRGHRQPRRPAGLGYYDLRVPGLMRRQAELAQRYGLHGFVFYYYRLDGRRILELPLEQVRSDPDWQMPFAVCWANENWTRQWDGQAKHILLRQEYGEREDRELIEDLLRYFEHPAYIRVDGAPLVLVYCPLELPDPLRTTTLWREICRQRGIGEIYLVAVESHHLMRTPWDPRAHGFDAGVEFPPHECGQPIDLPSSARSPDFTGVVHDYRRVVEAFCTRDLPAYKRFRGVMPGWDNTARRKTDSHVFVHSGPAEYQTWLEFAIRDTRAFFVGEERMVFINAWNEWAEAAYLEPDQTYGHAFLEATHNALHAERQRG
ncbi:MAG: glycoside hydrolase family 99-like domain-containing protein, partial [Planctomycetes bacterium]|nr:glycoside hydrolase family 99-like domain-containing protein [Planctomycetota bacterium]